MKLRNWIFSILVFYTYFLSSQATIGTTTLLSNAMDGYTLFAPIFSKNTYWTASSTPGVSCHLLPNGNLLRAGRIPGAFNGGGIGGRVEILDKNSQVLWRYDIANDSLHQHHICQLMPNGNILVAVWKKYSPTLARAKGFKNVLNTGIVSDVVMELKPIYPDKAEIVWQWDFMDHTIQDIDPALSNYGKIKDFPFRLDVNFSEDPGANPSEWIHLNAIDYNPKLDQILLSSKFHNEIYIVDHSTNITQASGSNGGRYGRGGDFLYRWGNPRSYGRGTRDNHHLFGQHNARWIADSLEGGGNLLLFNNGSNRSGLPLYSTVEELALPYHSDGSYLLDNIDQYQPIGPAWIYPAEPLSEFYSSRLSGVQRLPNGNTLSCVGNSGKFVEVNNNGDIVWVYINPVNNLDNWPQGSIITNNDVFTVTKYDPNYSGIKSLNVVQGPTLETYLNPYACIISNSKDENWPDMSYTYTNDKIMMAHEFDKPQHYQIFNIFGQLLSSGYMTQSIEISNVTSGICILKINAYPPIKFVKL
jgi:Arylsulfotransferase (ASST)